MMRHATAAMVLALGVVAAAERPALPQRLSETGLYADSAALAVDPRNRPFSPQYPLWSDGAQKSRWVQLPPGGSIDVRNVDAWDFPVGTRFWKEFTFGGRRVETRVLWKSHAGGWVFGSYVWNDTQTDAVLAPEDGLPNVAEISPGRFHSIPSVADCRACHDSARTEILGFTALQISTDRDPGVPHAERLTHDMVTVRTLVEEGRLDPPRPELASDPPRIDAADGRTRAVLGYLSTNCGACHNESSSLAPLGLHLKRPTYTSRRQSDAAVQALLSPTAKWQIPHVAEGTSAFVTPGSGAQSAVLVRMRSRRPSSQMPPLGTVVQDRDAVDMMTTWIESLDRSSR